MIRQRLLLLLLCIMVMIPLSAHDQSVIAGTECGFPPYCMRDESNNPQGFTIDLLTEILSRMDYEVEFSLNNWEYHEEAILNGEIDILPIVSRAHREDEGLLYTVPYLTRYSTIIVHEDDRLPKGIDELSHKRIGVLADDIAQDYLEGDIFTAEVVAFDKAKEALFALSEKEIDAVVMQRFAAFELVEKFGLDSLRIGNKQLEGLDHHLCFAVREDDRELLNDLNEGLAAIFVDQTFSEMKGRWLDTNDDQRRRFGTLIVGGDTNYAPFEYLDEEGNPTGFTVDLTHAIAREMGLDVEIRLGQWSEIYDGLYTGEIDILQGVLYSDERDTELFYSQPHTIINYVAVTREGETEVDSFSDMEEMTIYVQKGDLLEDILIEQGFGNRVIATDSSLDAILHVHRDGSNSCAVLPRLNAYYFVDTYDLDNLRISKNALFSSDYNFGVIDENEEMLYPFMEGLSILKASGEYREIYTKWFGAYEEDILVEDILFIALVILIPAILVIAFVYLWNRSLRNQVSKRTVALKRATDSLRENVKELEDVKSELAKREERLSYAIEGTRDGLWDQDLITGYTYHSSRYCKMLGYDQDELNDEQEVWQRLLHPDDRDRSTQAFHDHIKAGRETYRITYRMIDKAGKYHWIATRARIIYDEAGRAIRAVGFNTDVTDKIEAQQAKQEVEKKYELLFDSLADAVWLFMVDGTILETNRAALSMLGYDKDELIGRSILDLTDSLNLPEAERILDMHAQESIITKEMDLYTKDEKTIPCEVRLSLFTYGDELVILAVVRDISERKLLEESQQRNARLDSLGILAGGIAHDFNNLLSGLYGFLELAIMESENGSTQREYLDHAVTSFERTRSLTRQLLTFAKGGAPVLQTDDVVSVVKESAKFALSGSQIPVSYDIGEDLWFVDFDRNQISQVIENLIINAQQAMPEGGKIMVSFRNEKADDSVLPRLSPGDHVVISITDTGVGIPENMVDKIFDPYYSTKSMGSGLGLATSYSIIKKHGGMIDVASEPGVGTTFLIYLPRSISQEKENIQQESSNMEQFSGTVLILDDERPILDISSKMLSIMGFSTVTVLDGEGALQILKERDDITLGLFDLTIPGGLGAKDIIGEIREAYPDLPVIASSGYSDDLIMSNPTVYGFAGSLAKPYKMNELADCIKAALNRN